MGDRKGPVLTVVGSCTGCDYLLRNVRDARLGRTKSVACTHPTRADGGTIFGRNRPHPVMPSWCPELRRATVEHARAVLAKEGGA